MRWFSKVPGVTSFCLKLEKDTHVLLNDIWTFHSKFGETPNLWGLYQGKYPIIFKLHPLILNCLGKSNNIKWYLLIGTVCSHLKTLPASSVDLLLNERTWICEVPFCVAFFVSIWCRRRSPLMQCLIGVGILWHLLSSQMRSCLCTIGDISWTFYKRDTLRDALFGLHVLQLFQHTEHVRTHINVIDPLNTCYSGALKHSLTSMDMVHTMFIHCLNILTQLGVRQLDLMRPKSGDSLSCHPEMIPPKVMVMYPWRLMISYMIKSRLLILFKHVHVATLSMSRNCFRLNHFENLNELINGLVFIRQRILLGKPMKMDEHRPLTQWNKSTPSHWPQRD